MTSWVRASLTEPDAVVDLLHSLEEIGFFIEASQASESELVLRHGCEPALLVSDHTLYSNLLSYIGNWPNVSVLWLTADQIHYDPPLDRITRLNRTSWRLSDLFALVHDRIPPQDLQAEVLVGDWIEFRISSRAEVFHSTRRLFRQLLEYSLFDKTSLFHIHHSICEVLINAMEHGNGYDAEKQVLCSWVLFQDRLIVKIVDQGTGFILSQLPDTLEEPLEEATKRKNQGKRPGGYGLALVRRWMDLQVSDRGNTVILTKVFGT